MASYTYTCIKNEHQGNEIIIKIIQYRFKFIRMANQSVVLHALKI